MTLTCKLLTVSFLLGAILLLLGACALVSPPQNTGPRASTFPATPTENFEKQTIELFSVWGPGAELDALHALEHVYQKENPNIDVNDNPTGETGGGTDEYLLQRLRQEQPPDSIVIHAGKESLDYVLRGQLEPITILFHEEGFDKVMPPLLLEQITIKGEIYSVPLDIHRSNLLWYNPKVFQENNLNPPRTIDEFFAVAEQLKAKGITPLTVGSSFELGQLFESVLLATYGPDDYVRLVNGDPALLADVRLTAAIKTFKKMLDNSNTDRSATDWAVAAQRVLDGKAGMTVMGDWVNGEFKSEGAKLNVDYAWSAAPGTDGAFMWLSDSFGLPKGAPHHDAAVAWLKKVGSKQGQDAFNPIKGAIPARTDPDKSLYDEYQQWSIDQFRSSNLAPSIAHGAATPDSFRSEYSRAMIDFSSDGDEQALAEKLRDAAATQLTQ